MKKKLRVGIYAPSSPAHIWFEEKYQYAINELKNIGFQVKEGTIVRSKQTQGYRTSSPKERAKEFMSLIEDKEIDIIMPVIGGYNTASILPYLDYEKIEKAKKIICGYSDVTALHLAILSKTNISTIYGGALIPTFGEYGGTPNETKKSFIDCLFQKSFEVFPPDRWSNELLNAFTKEWKEKSREYKVNDGWKVLNPGNLSGEILIVNINTLVSLLGTNYIPEFKNKILILEEMDASIALEERNLNALKLSGVFNELKGLIFSKPEIYDCKGSNIKYSELIEEVLGKRDYPIIYNFDCGHTIPSLCLPQKSKVNIMMKNDDIFFRILENKVSSLLNK